MTKDNEQATEVELTAAEESLAEKLQARMDSADLTADDENADLTPTPDPEETAEPADDVIDDSEPTPADTDDGSGGEDGEEEGISDALYRAAIHQGWKPEEVDQFVKANRELAQRTFEKLYEATNKISSEFARFGRMKAQQEAEAAKAKQASAMSGVDLDAIKEEYGEDSAIYKTMKALINAIPAQAQQVQQQFSPDTENTHVRQIIESFFGSDDMKPYGDFYGTAKDRRKLTGEQIGHRLDVINMADEILIGAEMQGRKMDITEALERAHLIVAEPIRTEIIRKEIVSKVKKRASGTTLKPSSKKQSNTSKAKTGTELETIVEAHLRKAFGGK